MFEFRPVDRARVDVVPMHPSTPSSRVAVLLLVDASVRGDPAETLASRMEAKVESSCAVQVCEQGHPRRWTSPIGVEASYQSGSSDRRGPFSKQGSRYLRWALFEAALHACKHSVYAERYQRTKKRLGRQRGPKVAEIDLSRSSPKRSGTCSPATNPSLRQSSPGGWCKRGALKSSVKTSAAQAA